MRCFIPASDDEIYAYIERYGIDALVPYRVGMPAIQADSAPLAPPAQPDTWLPVEEPRRAA